MAGQHPDRPTIAVLIATYNRASMLDECLRHLAAQPFEAGDQVIVVDNGSTDDTAAVIDRHASCFPNGVVISSNRCRENLMRWREGSPRLHVTCWRSQMTT